MANKPVMTVVKLQVSGGRATPAPPIGPALGQHGINIQDFVNSFNEKTKDKQGEIVPVELTIYEDRSFDFIMKTPPVAELIKKETGLKKGSGTPNTNKVGKLTEEQVTKIATVKMPDINARDIEAAKKIVKGTARSMGVEIQR